MKTIVLNHKSYLSYGEITKYKEELTNIKPNNVNLILLPNLAYLSLFQDSEIKIGAQNFYSYNYGAYTGEISLEILKSLKITHTLVGHPERLLLGIDNYNQIREKLIKSINSGFKTILCIGHDENIKTLKKELKFFLKGIDHNVLENLIIAYEPESKIEEGIINLTEIEYVKNFVKNYMQKNYEINIPFFYGGSVNKENIQEILKITEGVLIGKISTNINNIKDILKTVDVTNEHEN